MNEQIRRFLKRIDEKLVLHAKEGERLNVYHLGRSALVLHHGFPLSTQDFDIIWMRESLLEERMIQEFGKGTLEAKELGLYIDPVPRAVPPVPGGFQNRCVEVAGDWKVLRLWELEVHDLAATKLKSFRPHDRQDLQSLCDQGLDAKKLRESLRAGYQFSMDGKDDEDDPDRVRAFNNLKRVEEYIDGKRRTI